MDFSLCVNRFIHFCTTERQLSPHTVQAYRFDLVDFADWRSRQEANDLNVELFKRYLDEMVNGRSLAASTIRRRFACLRSFFKWAAAEGCSANPFAGWQLQLPRRKRLPRALTCEEMATLLGALARWKASGPRRSFLNLAIRLMISTGIRVGELCGVKVSDISPDGSTLRIHGKGSRDRIVYVSDAVFRTDLKDLIRERIRHGVGSVPLFIDARGAPMKPRALRNALRGLGAVAGISRKVTPHMLRHTAATLLIEHGVDIRIVQRLLGHASIATTEIYTHVSDNALKQTLERVNILGTLAVA